MGKFACRIDSYVLRVTKKFRLPARHADGYKNIPLRQSMKLLSMMMTGLV